MKTGRAVLEVQKRYGSRALILAIGTGLLMLGLGHREACRGLVLGGVFSAVNFALMGQLLQYRLAHHRRSAARRSFAAMMLRYALLAVPLIVAVKSDRFNLPATVVGIFMVQLVILAEQGARLVRTTVKQ